MKVQPLADRVIVKRLEAKEKTEGGLYIPDNAKEKPQKGEVIAIGLGKVLDDGTLIKMNVVIGDQVLFGKYSGFEIEIDGNLCLFMREEDILGIVKK